MSWKTSLTSHELLERLQFRMAVKAGIAATLGLFLGVGFSQIFDRPDSLVSGVWTVITAIVVVQAYLGGTYHAAWIRFLGTFIGSFIGSLCTVLWGSNALTLGISVFGTVIVCSLFNLKESVRIASISVAVLNLLWGLRPEISPWTFGVFRFVDSCIGILIAVFVAHTVWPTQATRKVRLNMVLILEKLNRLMRSSASLEGKSLMQVRSTDNLMREIVELLRQSREHLEESRIEIRTKTSLQDWLFLIEHLEDAFEIVTNMNSVAKDRLKDIFDQELSTITTRFVKNLGKAVDEIARSLRLRKVVEHPVDVLAGIDQLSDDLERFREVQMSTKLPIKDAEAFFVYFYSLKALGEVVVKMDAKTYGLYK
ncbi:MAG: FUSC family protein [Chlamydiota bacterium]|nr:FUSC family protein [Chlamydiota bacterium]